MPCLPLQPNKGREEAQSLGAGFLVPVGRRDERVVPVLDHARCKYFRECLRRRVEVAQHDVAAPPTHEADCARVDTCHEEGHGTSGPHRSCADVFWCESHLGSHEGGCGAQRCGNFGTADGGPSNSVENDGEVCVWGGAMFS